MPRPGPQTKHKDKELNAMRFNLKEQRVLHKNLHILDAEASYSLKLIDLDNRGVKVFYKRFKDKVSKIKSHLRAEEIAELRDMEARGEMKDVYKPLNITGALRIADAEKRLNLRGHERHRKTKSAFNRRSVMESVDSLVSRDRPVSHSAVGLSLPSSNLCSILENKQSSINNAFVNASDKLSNSNRRPSSDMTSVFNEPITQIQLKTSPINENNLIIEGKSSNMALKGMKNVVEKISGDSQSPITPKENSSTHILAKLGEHYRQNDIKPDSSLALLREVDPNSIPESNSLKRGSLTVSFAVENKCDKSKRVTISDDQPPEIPTSRLQSSRTRSVTSRASNQTRSSTNTSSSAVSFSCHINAEKESVGEFTRMKTASMFSSNDDIMSPNLGESPYEERRRMLLTGELNKAEDLAERKDNFLDRVDEYIKLYQKQNAPININAHKTEMLESGNDELSDMMPENAHPLTRAQIRMLKNQQKMQEQFLARKKSSRELWKDINKCTYLRVPTDKIDLSGIVTLATEQMKLFKTLRPT